jgi:pimeloyl-ACP methyl ester carboxylesterase
MASGDSYTQTDCSISEQMAIPHLNYLPTIGIHWIAQNAPKNTKPLDDFIKDVNSYNLAIIKVHLVGHSLGGNLTFNYCSKCITMRKTC